MTRCSVPIALLLVVALPLAGCYSWTTIKPTELPKLNGASTSTSQGWGPPVTIVTVAKLEAPDGRVVQIEGESSARIHLSGQPPLAFEHPVLSSVDDKQNLVIKSGNRTQTTIPLGNIQQVEVSQFERGQTIAVLSLAGLLAGGLLALLIVPR